MKTLRFLGVALATVLFIACNKDKTPVEPQENYLNVSLACVGEVLDITNSPLNKASETLSDIYRVHVYSLTYDSGKGDYMETPYAEGVFLNSLDGVNIRLLEGSDYRFKVFITIASDQAVMDSREFTYKSDYFMPGGISVSNEGYYGELDRYTPTEGGSVTINTKRVSYAAKFIAEDLHEGVVSVSVNGMYNVALTTASPMFEKIYSFSNYYAAWMGRQVGNAMPGETVTYENYYTEKTLNIDWTKADGTVVPIGTYPVVFERNVKTTIRIKVEELSSSKGITVVKDETPMVNDNNEYYIQGGSVSEIPMNNGN